MSDYVIRGGEEGKRRLDLLAQIMMPTTETLLVRAGLSAGMRCLDLGCGGGHITRHLAQSVGAGGFAVGLDMDAVKLDAAREASAQDGLGNIEFRIANVSEWSEPGAYDLIYARFILSHLKDRPTIVATLRDALAPGGVLVLEDIDFTGAFCFPQSAAYARYCELYRAVVQRRGGDADLGLSLYALCLDAGFGDVSLQLSHPVHGGSHPHKALMLSTLVNIRESVLAEGLATAEELEQTIASMTRLTEDPRSIVALPRVFQVAARMSPAAG